MSANIPFLIMRCRVTEVDIDEKFGTQISVFPYESKDDHRTFRIPWPSNYVPQVGSTIVIQVQPFEKGWAL